MISTSPPRHSSSLFGKTVPSWGGTYDTGPTAHGKRGLGNWQSDHAWDVFAPAGTPVYAITDGTVSMVRLMVQSEKTVVYGDMVQVKSANGQPDVFYTHLATGVTKGQPIKAGDYIGAIIKHPTSASMPTHVHIGIDKGRYIRDFVEREGKLKLATGGGGAEEFATDVDSFVQKNALVIASVGGAIMLMSLLSGRRQGVFANTGRRLVTVAR